MPWRRFILAVVAGIIASAIFGVNVNWVVGGVRELAAWLMPASMPDQAFSLAVNAGAAAIVALPGVVAAVLVFAMLRGARGAETRCRKCGYNLRDITEPRCPECGERI
jgi:hypothetical protein